ncbi:hypothetical protein MMC07_001970 [Pseudocyphellaria aurata]|nr:hypothetical protein [Pseudocyphellaria aurata]
MRSRHSKYTSRPPPKTSPLTPDAISLTCLGERDFFRATVSCSFLSKKSKWGTRESIPVAILRFLLTLNEPRGYKISCAEVKLSLVSVDPDIQAPAVTEHVYPSIIHGPPVTRERSTNREVKPEIEGYGVSLGGIGGSADHQSSQTAHWTLTGAALKGVASWTWEANPLNPYKELVTTARSIAVVIENSKCKFQMDLKIEANLCEKSKNLFLRFQSRPKPTTTDVDFSVGHGENDLEPFIAGLEKEIHRLNALSVSGECGSFTSKQGTRAVKIACQKTSLLEIYILRDSVGLR